MADDTEMALCCNARSDETIAGPNEILYHRFNAYTAMSTQDKTQLHWEGSASIPL